MNSLVFFVPDMCGPCCEQTIRNAIRRAFPDEPFVVSLQASYIFKTVRVTWTDGLPPHGLQQQIHTIIEEHAGMRVFDDVDQAFMQHMLDAQLEAYWQYAALGLISGTFVLLLPLCLCTLPVGVMQSLIVLSIGLTCYLGFDFYTLAFYQLMAQEMTMDVLFAISTLVLMLMSLASLFVPELCLMLDGGLLIYGFRYLGLALQQHLLQSTGLLMSNQDRAPQEVVKRGQILTPVSALMAQDEILFTEAMILPVDGVLVGVSWCWVDESNVCGSATLVRKEPGDPLLAGTVLGEGQGSAWVRVGNEQGKVTSNLAQCDLDLRMKEQQRAPGTDQMDMLFAYFVPTVLSASLLTGLLVGCFFPPMIALQCAVNVLVCACPCTLGLIVPLASVMGARSLHDLNFYTQEVLLHAAMINHVVLDFHGTLTEGRPRVIPGASNIGLYLDHFAALEQSSTHPVAQAIVNFTNQSLPTSPKPLHVAARIERERGVSASINGVLFDVGDATFMEELGCAPEQMIDAPGVGERRIYLAQGEPGHKIIVASLLIQDPLRADAPDLIRALKARGYAISIATGGHAQEVLRCANTLGLDDNTPIRASCSSSQKADYLQALRESGQRVMMIGDRLNDSGAMAASHLSLRIALQRHEAVTALEACRANVVLNSTRLLSIVDLLDQAQKTMDLISHNLWFSVLYNVLALFFSTVFFLSTGVMLSPGVGVALMMVQMLYVFFSSCASDTFVSVLENFFNSDGQPSVDDEYLPERALHFLSHAV